MSQLLYQASRFGLIGIAASATHVAVGLCMTTQLDWPALVANIPAFATALLVSYLGNHAWTFRRSGFHGHHFPRFLGVALLSLTLNQGIIFAIVTLGGWPYLYGLLVVIAAVPALTFVLSRNWAFIAIERAAIGADRADSRNCCRASRATCSLPSLPQFCSPLCPIARASRASIAPNAAGCCAPPGWRKSC